MSELLITPAGAKVLRSMIVSCGSINCFETIKILDNLRETKPLKPIATIEDYGYRLKAFERIFRYAKEEKIDIMDEFQMAKYFGGSLHIKIMSEYAGHAGLARFLDDAQGLITHVLLPLKNNKYINLGREIEIINAKHLNPDEPGETFFHLGALVNIDLNEQQIEEILQEQAASPIFIEYLKEVPDKIIIPNEYYQALNCLAEK